MKVLDWRGYIKENPNIAYQSTILLALQSIDHLLWEEYL